MMHVAMMYIILQREEPWQHLRHVSHIQVEKRYEYTNGNGITTKCKKGHLPAKVLRPCPIKPRLQKLFMSSKIRIGATMKDG